jgi:hypothetical protein
LSRSHQIKFYAHDGELGLLQAAADAAGLSVPQLARREALACARAYKFNLQAERNPPPDLENTSAVEILQFVLRRPPTPSELINFNGILAILCAGNVKGTPTK